MAVSMRAQCSKNKTFFFKDEERTSSCERPFCHLGPCVFENPFAPGTKIRSIEYLPARTCEEDRLRIS